MKEIYRAGETNYFYDDKGNLFINRRRATKKERRNYRILGYLVAVIFVLLGIAVGKWLL